MKFKWPRIKRSAAILYLSSSLTQHSINKGHDGCFQVDFISVSPCTPVQIIYKCLWNDKPLKVFNIFRDCLIYLCASLSPTHLEARPFTGKTLVMQHGLQDFFVPTGHQAYSTHYFQHCHLSLNVFCGQALSDDVDALGVRQDVGTALRVVHQSFDATNQRCVDL